MNLVQFGTNSIAQRKRVKWYNREGSAEVIYEGQPVCYMYDTTVNILGYNKGTKVAGASTEESYLNEGKFMIVEKPYTDNLLWFAGVVASGDWCGKSIATLGYEWIEIYVPTGAVVPVRAGVAVTVGRTILSIVSDLQYLGQPLSANQGRPVAIADETNAALTTAGLCLARLCPDEFIYQDNTGDALIAAAAGTSDIVVNRINVTSAQTAGRFTALEVVAAITSTAQATGYGLALYAQADISAAVSGETAGSSFWMNLTGGTQAQEIYGVEIGLYESGANLTDTGCRISPLCVRDQLDSTNAPTGSHFMITFICDGTGDHPDGLFCANEIQDIAMTAAGSVTTNSKIAFKIGTPGSYTTYYIPCGQTVS